MDDLGGWWGPFDDFQTGEEVDELTGRRAWVAFWVLLVLMIVVFALAAVALRLG